MRIFIVTSFLLLTGCGSACNDPVFKYEPTQFDGNCFILSEKLVTESHFDNVEKVLIFYNVGYKRTSTLSIKLEKALLPELIYNYGTKAESVEFINKLNLK